MSSSFAKVAMRKPVSAPAWLQLAVMVNDGSGSMTLESAQDESLEGFSKVDTKAAAVEAALKTLIKDMKEGRGPAHFHFSFVTFNDKVTDARPPQSLLAISEQDRYDPTLKGTGGTAIHKGLDAAESIVKEFLDLHVRSEIPVSVVVVVMSDGEERDNEQLTEAVAARIRELPKTQLAACLFATRNAAAIGGPLLESMVSKPSLYQEVYNAAELRKFFSDSITQTQPGLPPGRDQA